jgi:hypothetical protein
MQRLPVNIVVLVAIVRSIAVARQVSLGAALRYVLSALELAVKKLKSGKKIDTHDGAMHRLHTIERSRECTVRSRCLPSTGKVSNNACPAHTSMREDQSTLPCNAFVLYQLSRPTMQPVWFIA